MRHIVSRRVAGSGVKHETGTKGRRAVRRGDVAPKRDHTVPRQGQGARILSRGKTRRQEQEENSLFIRRFNKVCPDPGSRGASEPPVLV